MSDSGQENSLASNSAPDINVISRVSRKKHSFQHIFVSKKDIPVSAVSAVTIIVSDNTKIFYHPMSTSRSLAKKNDRRLKPILTILGFGALDGMTCRCVL